MTRPSPSSPPTRRVSASQGKPRHRPLGEAIREYAGAGNRPRLLALLEPVQRAATRSGLLRELVDSGDVYRPLGFTPDDAYRFLKDIPVLEDSGVVVRVPDWWAAKRPPRPQVQVTVGSRAPAGLGTDALLDFDVRVTLDGHVLTAAEIEQLASASAGLALIRGKWVELDPARLSEALDHWKKVQASAGRDGLSFIEGHAPPRRRRRSEAPPTRARRPRRRRGRTSWRAGGSRRRSTACASRTAYATRRRLARCAPDSGRTRR